MNHLMTTGALTALSGVMAYFLTLCCLAFACISWKYRAQFERWVAMPRKNRIDAILNICFCGYFAIAAFLRITATHLFATHEWETTQTSLNLAIYYLPWADLFLSGILLWHALELLGEKNYLRAWLAIISGGAALGTYLAWRF